jgi:uncharacterized protein YegJ (DUF2314 family)
MTMARMLSFGLMILALLSACSSGYDEATGSPGEAGSARAEADDREMNAAMAEARRTLDEFERRVASPTPTQTMAIIKGRFTQKDKVEHMWLNQIVVTPEGYRGVLGNDPYELTSVKAGETLVVGRDDVSDWIVVDDGKLVGGYTMRVLRSRLPAEERAAFDEQNGIRIED